MPFKHQLVSSFNSAEHLCDITDVHFLYRQDETPLFQAAREGSYEACKLLLDHYANRKITDHMDRLPRDVAAERLHHDIIRLLDEHVTMSPQVGLLPDTPAWSGSSGQWRAVWGSLDGLSCSV